MVGVLTLRWGAVWGAGSTVGVLRWGAVLGAPWRGPTPLWGPWRGLTPWWAPLSQTHTLWRDPFSSTRMTHWEVFKLQVTGAVMISWWGRAR